MKEKFKIDRFLFLFSWLYGLITWVRNILFDWKILPSESFPVPVISIGNLAVGGTGKTSHAEFVVNFLSKKYRVAVLSRGYKRKSRGFVLANSNTSVLEIGDEPFQFYRRCPGVSVAVDVRRRRGIAKLLKLPIEQRPQVIVLDDAFQHRYVLPSLSILLTDYKCLFSRDKLLPSGRLRESVTGRKRADIIVCTKCPRTLQLKDYQAILSSLNPFPHQVVYFTYYRYKFLRAVFPGRGQEEYVDIQYLKEQSCSFVLIAALADSSGIIDYLSRYTDNLYPFLFVDHHFFSRKDLMKIEKIWNKITNKCKLIVTSEKDTSRFIHHPLFLENLKKYLYSLPIELGVHHYPDYPEYSLVQKIESHVEHLLKKFYD